MNAVIVDLQGGYAAALCEDGTIEKIPDDGYEIGQKIQMPSAAAAQDNIIPFSPTAGRTAAASAGSSRNPGKRTGTPRFVKRASALAATLILVVSLGTGIAYAMPYGTVSLDSEASIEYTINCFDYVIDVSAANEDGNDVLDSIDSSMLINRKIESAVASTLEQTEDEDYYDSASDIVLSVGTRGTNHSQQLAERLGGIVGNAYIVPVTMADVETAHENDMTAGQNWLKDNIAPADGTDMGSQGNTENGYTAPDGPGGFAGDTGRQSDPGSNPEGSDLPGGLHGENSMNGQENPAGSGDPGRPDSTERPDSMNHNNVIDAQGSPENGAAPAE